MKRAIFIDLDGTLLPEGELHKVSDFNIDTLKEAQDKGIYTVISTGRGKDLVDRVHAQIDFSDYARFLITLNGGEIYDLKEDKKLWSFPIDKDLLQELITWAESNKYMYVLTQEKKFYVKSEWKYFYLRPFFKRFEIAKYKDFKMPEYDVMKIGFFVGTKKKVLKVQKELLAKYGDKVEVVTSGKGYFIEVTAKGVSKGAAVKLITNYLDIDTDHCAAFGDSMNDYSAFQVVKYPVAMANGEKKLKEMAYLVAEEAKEDGFGHALKELMRQMEEKEK